MNTPHFPTGTGLPVRKVRDTENEIAAKHYGGTGIILNELHLWNPHAGPSHLFQLHTKNLVSAEEQDSQNPDSYLTKYLHSSPTLNHI